MSKQSASSQHTKLPKKKKEKRKKGGRGEIPVRDKSRATSKCSVALLICPSSM
jgi:hypothetical protein